MKATLNHRFYCKICGRWFTTHNALGGHMNSHEERECILACTCGKKFRSKQAFNGHIANCKSKLLDGTHKCKCGYETNSLQGLYGHQAHCKDSEDSAKPVINSALTPNDFPGQDNGKKQFMLVIDGNVEYVGTEKKLIQCINANQDCGGFIDGREYKVYELGKEIKIEFDTKVTARLIK